jgi:UDP-2,3-diacylglucosamine pyrophosphatase LpxH
MKSLPWIRCSQLHVISDLHLGGQAGFQIFDQGATLEAFLDFVIKQASAEQQGSPDLAVLINGDLVDFLAEAGALCFDPLGASTKLDRIFSDPSFQPVWNGLKRFVQTPRCRLLVNLGNHDLELALPWVSEQLVKHLSGDDPAARGRITLGLDGFGFRCQVGTATVLCVHGNEVDTWNITDHDRLRRIGRDVTMGRAVEGWIPNAGSAMVIDVMNDVKRRFPFVDLLKPEQEAVVPVLVALDHTVLGKLTRVFRVLGHLEWDKIRRKTGFLAVVESPEQRHPADERSLNSLLVKTFGQVGNTVEYRDGLLDAVEHQLKAGRKPMELLDADRQAEYLGKGGALFEWLKHKPPSDVLRTALDSLRKDRSFETNTEDATFRDLDKWIGGEIDIIIAGHTHLERALNRADGNGYYYNSGTWVRLIQIAPEVLDSASTFEPIFNALKSGTLSALDATEGLVQRKPAVVSVWQDRSTLRAELRHVRVEAGGAVLDPVPNTQYTRSGS